MPPNLKVALRSLVSLCLLFHLALRQCLCDLAIFKSVMHDVIKTHSCGVHILMKVFNIPGTCIIHAIWLLVD